MQGFSGADLASLMREAAMCALKESLAKDRANLGQVIARSFTCPCSSAITLWSLWCVCLSAHEGLTYTLARTHTNTHNFCEGFVLFPRVFGLGACF
jgi:SpoVK/Ycf46/Vps4 family AAA+-type ATPase